MHSLISHIYYKHNSVPRIDPVESKVCFSYIGLNNIYWIGQSTQTIWRPLTTQMTAQDNTDMSIAQYITRQIDKAEQHMEQET